MDYLLLVGGLAVLVISGEFLVKGAVGIALRFRISTLVVGMTVVSFGTSAPELLVSVKAALAGLEDISIGNVIGSNIANLALVLGLTAVIMPLKVERDSLRIDWVAMMAATLVLYVMMYNLRIERWEGIVLLVALIGFTVWLIRRSRSKKTGGNESEDDGPKPGGIGLLVDFGWLAVGCVGMVFGSGWMLDGAVAIAESFGVSELVISVTIIAFGTSVPELVTSVVAAIRKQSDISIGNLIGSNLFNICAILGTTAIIKPIGVSEIAYNEDMLWVLGVSAVLLPLMAWQMSINRVKGGLLFLVYAGYIVSHL